MKEPLISIIIPVFNVKNYLKECMDSCVSQTYSNYEIIVIDDGSTDGSDSILDEYASRCDKITIIHKNNEGVSKARNMGIECACGEYLMFVDSDDVISENILKVMMEQTIKNNSDVTICDIYSFNNGEHLDDSKISEKNNSRQIGKTELYTMINISQPMQYAGPWAKLIKRTLFKNIRFNPDMHVGEDLQVCSRIYHNAHKVIKIQSELYFYRKRNGSATRSLTLNRIDLSRVTFGEYDFYTKENEQEIAAKFLFRGFKSLINLKHDFKLYAPHMQKEAQKELDKLYKENIHKLKQSKIDRINKCFIILMYKFNFLYSIYLSANDKKNK